MRIRTACIAAAMAGLFAWPASAQTLQIGQRSEPTSIDPHYWLGFQNVQLGLTIFGHLVNFSANFRLAPGLATSWKAIDDLTWEFKLRDTKWQDGSPFTADDVLFTFERGPGIGLTPVATYVRGKTITKIDNRTIHIKTTVPSPTVPNDMAAFAIVSKKHGGAPTEEYNSGKAAIGIGPYKFVEWTKGDRIVLEANPTYWGGKPEFQRVILKMITSNASRVAALLAGDVDMIEKVPTTDITLLKQDARLNIVQTPSCRTMNLYLDSSRDISPDVRTNAGQPYWPNPVRDWRVRKAINKAIDRKGIVERVMDHNAVAASQIIAKGLFGFNPEIPVEPYDPEGAKKLLQQAGYGDGFQITLSGTNNRYDNDSALLEAIAQMLTQVGIKTDVRAMPVASFFSRANKREFSMAMTGNCPATAEAGSPLKEMVHTTNPARGLGRINRGGYSNFRVDALIDEATSTIDDNKREKLYRDALKAATDDVSIIALHQQVSTWALKKGFTYEGRTDGMTLPAYVSKSN